MERVVDIYRALKEVADEIDTVFTLGIVIKCKDGKSFSNPYLTKQRSS